MTVDNTASGRYSGYMYNNAALYVSGAMALSQSAYISWGPWGINDSTEVGFTTNKNGTLMYKDNPTGSWTELGNTRDNTVLGDASGDTVTFNASTVAIPNNLNFDSNTLYLDASNNRVGIGTTSPSVPLEIDGDMKFSPTAISTAHITSAGSLTVRADANVTIGDSTADSIRIGRTNTALAKIHIRSGADTDLVVSNSMVGIGTDSPDTALEVLNTSTQQKWSYDSDSFATMTVAASSNTTLAVGETGTFTLDVAGDVALSADGGNITMDDGTTTVFDFDVDDPTLKIMDDADTGDYFSINVAANGATTITTVDDDAAAAHLTLTVDGDITMTPAGGNLLLNDGSNNVFDFDVTDPTLKIMDDADTGDYFSINVAANGATTLTTVDDDAAAANLTFTVDGAIKLDGAGVEIENDSTTGAAALLIDNDDTDQIALDIDAANIDADVIDITADAVTTAAVMDVTMDALTTGTGINLQCSSNSLGNSTFTQLITGSMINVHYEGTSTNSQALVRIHNDNTAATRTIPLVVINDASPSNTYEGTAHFIGDHTATNTSIVTIENKNASTSAGAGLSFYRSDGTAEADDMRIGNIQFKAINGSSFLETFAQIDCIASDITNNDEGAQYKFEVMAGGTAGTAALKNLLSIGGEDVANGTACSVVINEDGIDCDFRVEGDSDANLLFADAGNGRIGIGLSDPDSKLEVFSATTQQKWSYDADSYATLTVADSSNTTLATGESGNLTLDAAGDIILDPAGGDVLPPSDNTVNLGSGAKRWANVYTADLHLRNERGDWTIVEEEDYLCVVNNKTNKRYKMMLEEIQD